MTESASAWDGFDWARALSPERLAGSRVTERGVAEESHSDRARVLYSAAFRRLQLKAQVFSLAEDTFVRNRLTHSLEVAHVGREIARLAADSILASEDEGFDLTFADALVAKTEVACLVHDIGNPPFGHFGEAAIQSWFDSEEATGALKHAGIDEDMMAFCLADFIAFDGNPQGLRNIARLTSSFRDEFGLNLTASQLLGAIKYPILPNEAGRRWKKCGVFLTESQVVLGAAVDRAGEYGIRHPVAYLMEAADDVSYCISDLEDGIERRLLRLSDVSSELTTAWNSLGVLDGQGNPEPCALVDGGVQSDIGRFVLFKAQYTRAFIAEAARRFASDPSIRSGESDGLFEGEDAYSSFLALLKGVAGQYLFSDYQVEEVELTGFHTITGLLRHYAPLLRLTAAEFMALCDAREAPRQRRTHLTRLTESLQHRGDGASVALLWRLFNRLPEKHYRSYRANASTVRFPDGLVPAETDQSSAWEWLVRAHLVVDYIAGMTDHFAVETYQRLSGIRV